MSWAINRYSESYAINTYAQTPCLLISGWSTNSDIFEWLLPGLAQYFVVYTADVSDLPQSMDDCVDELSAALLQWLFKPALVIGWSLGGNIALQLAKQHPQQVAGLSLLNCSPVFVAREDWPCGMDPQQFAAFQQGIEKNTAKTLKRFDRLQSVGDARQQPLIRALGDYRAQQQVWQQQDLQTGLGYLQRIDQRDFLSDLPQAVQWCFGAEDRLVSRSTADAVASLAAKHPIEILDDCAHLPFLSRTDQFFRALLKCFEPNDNHGEKQKIAAAFSQAAESYERFAGIQQWAAEQLLQQSDFPVDAQVLDAGCGTGRFTARLAEKYQVTGLDIAPGMVEYGRSHYPQVSRWLTGDIEQLPLADQSLDGIFSSLAVQWSQHPQTLMTEWQRVLKQGGRVYLATLGPQTLQELKNSFAEVDNYQHVNRFLALEDWQHYARLAGFELEGCHSVLRHEYYPELKDLLQSLKKIGAHTVLHHGRTGLMGKKRWQALQQEYEQYRDQQGLPVAYQLIFLQLRKTTYG